MSGHDSKGESAADLHADLETDLLSRVEPETVSPFQLLATRLGPHLETAQTVTAWVAGGALLLGFLASIDILLFPRGEESAAWLFHPLLFLLGAVGGLAAAARGRQVDEIRWRVLDDPMLTGGERELAHREAERQRRWAGTVFFVAPILLGYWLAYQFAGEDGGSLVTFLLTASPMVGFLSGLLLTQWALGPEKKPY